ncbi:hypothetical protein EDC56_1605 [Sinobacterium caligoides]|uniref:SMc04008-like domain-containing protein n=1 Tax=Sinobacterium caligoides TaxID=933926 RepID=A0A3N2DMZ1_9GAMM|nr:DUF1244 domain-containing protein [Sinobacterium caligoides]ROS01177.1 hypothetical protein EDC56_1605 [Sinobacterium caligoides]
MNKQKELEIEAAAFRRLLAHLDERNDVQNIDLMNLAGFCRNCLSKWYRAEAEERGLDLDYDQARERIYGMPYEDWKVKNQKPASVQQLKDFEESKPKD